MPLFKYVGKEGNMKNVYGFDFSDHAVVDVPEENALAIRKLTGNRYFEKVVKVRKKHGPKPSIAQDEQPVTEGDA